MRKIWMVAAATTTVFMLSAQDGKPLSLQLESFARPVFSGIGNINQLFVQLIIEGAQASQHVGETLYTIQWELVSGGCLVP